MASRGPSLLVAGDNDARNKCSKNNQERNKRSKKFFPSFVMAQAFDGDGQARRRLSN
jgi:hypothetical protein